MKILQLIHKIQNRGAETFACQLSNQLLNLGHEVKMVFLYNGEATLPYEQEIIILDEKSSNSLINYRGWKKLARKFYTMILKIDLKSYLKTGVVYLLYELLPLPFATKMHLKLAK